MLKPGSCPPTCRLEEVEGAHLSCRVDVLGALIFIFGWRVAFSGTCLRFFVCGIVADGPQHSFL